MPDKPATEKTERPTPRRLQKARQKGQVPQSREIASVVSIAVLTVMVTLLAPKMVQWFTMQMKQGMSCGTSVFTDSKIFMDFFGAKVMNSIALMCPVFAALFIGAVFAGLAVGGPNFAPAAVRLQFEQLNPITGLERLVNAKSIVGLLTSILKLFLVGIIVWVYIHSKLDALAALRWAWSAQMLAAIGKIILGLMIRICLVLLVIGIADTIYQKWKYIEDLKMTRQEVKEERKEVEGSPEVKRRVRKIQFEMAARRMLQEVPKASVVLVNPTHVAVALRYEPKTMEAPIMLAKGADHMAEKIREIARSYGVPIVRKPELARTIYSTVKLGGPIPQTLYVAVAEVLAMIYRLRRRK